MSEVVSLDVIGEVADPAGSLFDQHVTSHEADQAEWQRRLLDRRVARLPHLERRVITWRYGLGGEDRLSQRQVAHRLGVSPSSAHRFEQRALTALRDMYGIDAGHRAGRAASMNRAA